jgi:hypothetical protein
LLDRVCLFDRLLCLFVVCLRGLRARCCNFAALGRGRAKISRTHALPLTTLCANFLKPYLHAQKKLLRDENPRPPCGQAHCAEANALVRLNDADEFAAIRCASVSDRPTTGPQQSPVGRAQL